MNSVVAMSGHAHNAAATADGSKEKFVWVPTH